MNPIVNPILQAEDLSIRYRIGTNALTVIENVAFSVESLSIHGLVGESGSGKSTLGLALLRYLAPNAHIASGSINYAGRDLVSATASEMSQLWGNELALVPQNPLDALNPSLRIGEQLTEITRRHLQFNAREATQRALHALGEVQLPDPAQLLQRYPHQLSGGQLQRVMLAMALSGEPRLLVLDEPTTALDVTTQAGILDLVRMRVREKQAAAIYISHDLGSVAQLCDTISVLYGGQIMESAPTQALFQRPLHPYTIGLLGSLPGRNNAHNARLSSIRGFAPSLAQRKAGCAFAERCPIAIARCHSETPPLEQSADGHQVRCWRWQDVASGQLSAENRPEAAGQPSTTSPESILDVDKLSTSYPEGSRLQRIMGMGTSVRALHQASFHINARSTLGIVGESGSGKTTLARSIAALYTADSGSLELLGQPISLRLTERRADELRKLALVWQNPADALNPTQSIGYAIARPLRRLLGWRNETDIQQRVGSLLEAVGLAQDYAERKPNQLSGGEKQRAAIARAFAAHPDLVVLDEPTSALDVSVQALILNLLKDLRDVEGASYLIISHDLEVIAFVADWVVVMYLGEIVEQGTTEQVYSAPKHPYTEALLSAIPSTDPTQTLGAIRLEGDIPSPRHKPSGCPFHTRCPRFLGDVCRTQAPPLQQGESGHAIRCHIPMDELKRLQESELA